MLIPNPETVFVYHVQFLSYKVSGILSVVYAYINTGQQKNYFLFATQNFRTVLG